MTDIQSAVEHYEKFGFTPPVDVFSREEALRMRGLFFAAISQSEEETRHISADLANWHSKHPWCREMVANPRIVDLLSKLLGDENIMVWSMMVWFKEAGDVTYVPWHQDGAFWAMKPIKTMTAWIALGDVEADNGALHFLPGRHRELLDHKALDDPKSEFITQLSRSVGGDDEVELPMTAGQACFFDAFTLHRSGPNHSSRARVGCGIRYGTPDVTFPPEEWRRYQPEIVMLRGRDTHGLNPSFMRDLASL